MSKFSKPSWYRKDEQKLKPSYMVLAKFTYSGMRSLYMIPSGRASSTTRTPVKSIPKPN